MFLFRVFFIFICCGVTLRRRRMLMRRGCERLGGVDIGGGEGRRLKSDAMML